MNGHTLCAVHVVHDLDAAAYFFENALSMPAQDRGERWLLVDNSSVAVRLVCGKPTGQLTLELVGRDIEEMVQTLGSYDGVRELRPLEWVSTWRQELWLTAPFGLQLVVARHYDEDELGIVPPLPNNLGWEQAAIAVVQDLLRHVPVALRGDARRRVTEEAENRALAEGRVTVTLDEAIDVLVQRTPSFQLERLREELKRHTLDPERWAASFERGAQ